MSNQNYFFIFKKLVIPNGSKEINKEDFVGFIAYIIYKQKKIEFFEQYKKCHNTDTVPEKEVTSWEKSTALPHLDIYQSRAQEILQEVIDLYTKDKIDSFKEEYKKRIENKEEQLKKELERRFMKDQYKDLIENTINKCKPQGVGHIVPVLHSIFGTLCYSIIVIVVLFTFSGLRGMMINSVLEELKPKTQETQPEQHSPNHQELNEEDPKSKTLKDL